MAGDISPTIMAIQERKLDMAHWFKCPHCGRGVFDEMGETLVDYEEGLYRCTECGGIMSAEDDIIDYEEYAKIENLI